MTLAMAPPNCFRNAVKALVTDWADVKSMATIGKPALKPLPVHADDAIVSLKCDRQRRADVAGGAGYQDNRFWSDRHGFKSPTRLRRVSSTLGERWPFHFGRAAADQE